MPRSTSICRIGRPRPGESKPTRAIWIRGQRRCAASPQGAPSDDLDALLDEFGLAGDASSQGKALGYDLPLPGGSSAKRAAGAAEQAADSQPGPSAKPARDTVASATRKPGQTRAAVVSPAADRAPNARPAASSERPPDAKAPPAKAAANPAASGVRKRAADSRPANGHAVAKPAATQRTAPAAAAADPRAGTGGDRISPDVRRLPDDPGYDIISISSDTSAPAAVPALATTPAATAEPTTAATPAASEALGPATRRAWRLKALVSLAVLAGVTCGALALYGGWFGEDAGPSPYDLARARAASRPRAGASPKEPLAAPAVPAPPADSPPASPDAAAAHADPAGRETPIEIGIAYGTEKRNWLEWAAGQFAATAEGRRIQVRLIPLGSVEGAHAILDGDRRIHVWSPASSLYREAFVRDWEAKYQGNPIQKEEALALTPMVLVMWRSRYEAFTGKSPEVSLRTIWYAMQARQGWATIAGKPQWGRFKFGHTNPNQSNSGLMTLILLAYSFGDKTAGLSVREIVAPQFQDYLTRFNAGVAQLSNSTGNLMKDMALKGPTSYDALIVYESVAIDYLASAEGRWEPLQVVYPKQNLWNENPYCILKTPWTTEAHQEAAGVFLKYLLSEPIQARALDHGFRPANPAVAVKGPESPFTKFADYGLSISLAEVCEVPSREVIDNLQQMWIRTSAPEDLNAR